MALPRTTKNPSIEREYAAAAPNPDVACNKEKVKKRGENNIALNARNQEKF